MCRKLATNSEIIAEVHKHTAQILCVIVSAERVWDSQICHKAFHNRNDSVRALFARAVHSTVDARRCRRTSQRTATPREKLGKVQQCRYRHVPAAALPASSRDVEWVVDPLSPENKPNIKPIPLSSGSHAVSLSLSVHSHRRGQGKRESG